MFACAKMSFIYEKTKKSDYHVNMYIFISVEMNSHDI